MGQGQSSIPNEEVDALVDFYQALGGENKWKHKTGWCQPTIDPENWFGVEVMLGHVIGIELPANGLEGTIPESIARLPFLRVLDLSRNRIHGSIPSSIGKMTSLSRLELSCNELTGPIPQSICDCESLQEIHVYQNRLSGILPPEIGKLEHLRSLQLQHNNITGCLPTSICLMRKLLKMSVRGNRMQGTIPVDIGNMSSLVFLSLRNNEFSGNIPESIGNCRGLEFLNLSSNRLSGSIPDTIGGLDELEYLYLFDNALEGRIPSSIAKLRYLKESDFRDNQLDGEIPDFLDDSSSFGAVFSKWKNRKANHTVLGDPVLVTNALISSISSGSQNFVQRLDSYGDDTRIFPLPIHALSDGGVLVSDLKSISTNYESNNNNSSNRNEQEDSKKLSLASLNVAGLRTQFQQRSSFLKPDWVENYCLKDDLSINRAVWGVSNIKKKNIDFIFMYFYSNVIKYFDVYSM